MESKTCVLETVKTKDSPVPPEFWQEILAFTQSFGRRYELVLTGDRHLRRKAVAFFRSALPHKRGGRPRSPLVTKIIQMCEAGHSVKTAVAQQVPGFAGLTLKAQEQIIERMKRAVRARHSVNEKNSRAKP